MLWRGIAHQYNVEEAWESMSPHIMTILGYSFRTEDDKLRYADVALQIGGYNRSLGRYDVAAKTLQDSLALRQEVLGTENPSTLTSMNNLASVLSDQGKYEQAEQMH